MIKFRTMYADAPERQERLEAENEAEGALFKVKDDPRVTSFGRLLRRFAGRGPAGAERPARRDEPGRAASTRSATIGCSSRGTASATSSSRG